MANSETDIKVRKALAWQACHKLSRIWKSTLKRSIKIRLFRATVETVLLYGCNTWTLTEKLTRQLDGTYTNMLRMVLNISWRSHTTNEVLYGRVPELSQTIAKRRLELARHCIRHPEEVAHNPVLWEPTHGQPCAGGQNLAFINQHTLQRHWPKIHERAAGRDEQQRYLASLHFNGWTCRSTKVKFLIITK